MKIANAQLWVHDQDEALAFYTEKLGMEVRSDVTLPEMGDFRWLTVSPAGQDDVAIVLMAIPGPPMMDEDTTRQVEDLMAFFLALRGTQAGGPSSDQSREFRRRFDLMALQRNLKALGTFGFQTISRGNPVYIQYIPRTLSYVRLNMDRNGRFARLRELLAEHLEELR